MVCDWTSVSQEMEGNSDATDWANKNINKRWTFTEEQVKLIYDIINIFKNNNSYGK